MTKKMNNWDKLKSVCFTADRKELHKRALLRAIRVEKPMSFWQRLLVGLRGHRQAFAGAMAGIVLLTTGGVTYAAEQALPGETLHPVKTQVIEEVRSVLHFGEEAKAEWDKRVVERRLEEAEELKELERWTEELEEEMAEFLDFEFEDEFLMEFEEDFEDWFEEPFWEEEMEYLIEELEEEFDEDLEEFDEEEWEILEEELEYLEEDVYDELEDELWEMEEDYEEDFYEEEYWEKEDDWEWED